MWPFKKSYLLDREEIDWLVENFSWLVSCWSQTKSLSNAQLVLPKLGFFDTGNKSGHALAQAILTQIQAYAQIPDWPIELVQGSALPERSNALVQIEHGTQAMGTFQMLENGPVRISYAANLTKDPQGLIATLAHEVAHYILAGAHTQPICEDHLHEFLTDLTAVYLGFGVFLANNAFEFSQFRDDAMGTQGWQSQRRGYLSENQLVTALALFLSVKQIDPVEASKCLKPHLAKSLKQALVEGGRATERGLSAMVSQRCC